MLLWTPTKCKKINENYTVYERGLPYETDGVLIENLNGIPEGDQSGSGLSFCDL